MAVAKVMKKDNEKNMSLRKLWKWGRPPVDLELSLLRPRKLVTARCWICTLKLFLFPGCQGF
jgi:hypothetical protein